MARSALIGSVRIRWVGLAGVLVLLLGAGFAVAELVPIAIRLRQGGFIAFNDFFAHWSSARFVRGFDPAAIYDPDALHRFQLGLEPALRQSFPFPYPPPYLFLVWPFGALPFAQAQLAWDTVGLLLFGAALAGPRFRLGAIALALVAPATTMALAYGQNGLIEGALLLGGLRLARTRPGLGGVLLGLATVKPALGLLVPVALLASRAWRTILAATATATALALLAAWAFGPSAWPAWLGYASRHAGWLQGAVSAYRSPTVMATLSLAGASPAAAQAGQLTLAILVAAAVALCCWRRLDDPAIAAVLTATFLATPFAFVYDLPMTAAAVLLLARSHRGPWHAAEIAILALGVLFPALTTLTSRFFYMNPVALLLLFALSVRECLRRPRDPSGGGQGVQAE